MRNNSLVPAGAFCRLPLETVRESCYDLKVCCDSLTSTSTCSVQTGKSRERQQKLGGTDRYIKTAPATATILLRELASPIGGTLRTRPRSSKPERRNETRGLDSVLQYTSSEKVCHAALLVACCCNKLAINITFTQHGCGRESYGTSTSCSMTQCNGRTKTARDRHHSVRQPARPFNRSQAVHPAPFLASRLGFAATSLRG